MAAAAQQTVQADPMLVRCLTLHQTVLEHSRHGLTKEEIYQRVDGYAGRYREAQFLEAESRERELSALERRFSSDKQYLRATGIPLEESEDVTGEHRYRIRTEDYGLPDLELTEQERLVLHQAQLLFSTTSVRGLQHALWAISGTSDTVADQTPAALQASIGSDAELDQLLQLSLIGLRRPVTFSYTGRGRLAPERRRVIPLALGARGHWYLIAHDLDREAQRVFRLDRIHDAAAELKPKDLDDAERDAVRRITQGPDLDPAQTQRILASIAGHQEKRESLEGVIHAHTGPAPDPGRLRPALGETRRENIGLKTDRVINMAAFLLSSPGVPPSRLMSEYGVTAEQLHRDLLSIEQSGPNVGMSRYVSVEPELPLDRHGFEQDYLSADEPITLDVPDGVSAATMRRPISLTKPGALSLLIALKTLQEVLPAGSEHLLAAARSVEAKVLGVAPESIASAAAAMTWQRAADQPQSVSTIEAAITGDFCVELEYTDAGGAATRRTVEPTHLLYDGPHTYLRAWCRRAAGERLFRLDRIQTIEALPQTPRSARAHALNAAGSAAPTVERGPSSLDGVVLRFAPFAAAAAQRYAPELQRRDQADGTMFIRTHFRSAAAAVGTCLAAGGDIELVRPAHLRQEVLRAAQRQLGELESESREVL